MHGAVAGSFPASFLTKAAAVLASLCVCRDSSCGFLSAFLEEHYKEEKDFDTQLNTFITWAKCD